MKKYFSLFLALVMLVTAIPFVAISSYAANIKGDGNGDGQVTAMDARLALRYVAGLEKNLTDSQIKALDLSGDAKITAVDARMILRQVAGLSNDIDTDADQMRDILRLFGYEYDADQNIYYTSLNAWQRNFGFTDLYDNAAVFTTMFYQTLKIDFDYNGLMWRLQWWKGQYGVLEGAEMGVYTKKPENKDAPFYKCAENENLLEMYFEYYQTAADYNKGNPLFTRYEQEHWWITGFKFGTCNPSKNVLKAVLFARDTKMADGIENGLKNVTDKNGKVNGFVEYRPWHNITTNNFYTRTKLSDGRLAYCYTDDDFVIAPYKASTMKESQESFGIRFEPKGNTRKFLDITVVIAPHENFIDGQCYWIVWAHHPSKREYIENHNKHILDDIAEFNIPKEYAEHRLIDPEDYDLD